MKKDQSPRAGLVVAALLLGLDTICPAEPKNAPNRRKAKGALVPKPLRDRMNAHPSAKGAHA